MSCYTCKCKPVLFPALSCLVRACQLSKLALYLYLSVFCSIQFLAAASISIVAIFQQVVTAEISGSFKKKIQISSLTLVLFLATIILVATHEKIVRSNYIFFLFTHESFCLLQLESIGYEAWLFPTTFLCSASKIIDVRNQSFWINKPFFRASK